MSLQMSSSQPAADGAAVPIAVHPHDLDTVFLSKAVTSLYDVFTNAVDSRFDLAPLPTRSTSVEAAALPFSGGSQPYVASTPRDASANTSAITVEQRCAQVAQITEVHRTRAAGPCASDSYARHMDPVAAPPPQLLVVPLDAYHLLLSFRDVDVASGSDGPDDARSDFAAAACRATSSVEKLSAHAPGPRPPRSGVAVVRRVEGEMRPATTASNPCDSFAAAANAPAASSEGDAAAAAAAEAYPTVSRVAEHLPFLSFDGWVRDYTVYGLSRNAAALREAWADKVRERTERRSSVGATGNKDVKPTSIDACNRDSDAAGARMHPAGVVIEVEAGAGGVGEAQASMPAEARMPVEAPSSAAASTAGAADFVQLHASEQEKEFNNTVDAKTVSPSLEPLNCSSTTTTTTTTNSRSSSSEHVTTENKNEDKSYCLSNHPPVNTEEAAAAAAAAATNVTVPPHASTATDVAPSPPSPQAQAQQLWDEERRREMHISSLLAHRFLVADGSQHAIWAMEVTLPSMEVRVVAPAEFYALEEEEDEDVVQHEEDKNNAGSEAEACSPAEDTQTSTGGVAGVRLPRRKLPTEVTQARPRTPSPTTAAITTTTTTLARPRSPSPAEPPSPSRSSPPPHKAASARTTEVGTPLPRGAGGASLGDVSPSCPASAATHAPRGRSFTKSASSSVSLVEAVPTPLIGGARGFVDGHFSMARFNRPGALCWRLDDDDDGAESETGEEEARTASRRRATAAADDPHRSLLLRPRHDHRSRCAVLFISDVGNCAIRYANFRNRLVRTIVGMDGVPGYRDGSCVSSLLRGATALAWCSAGLLFTDGPNNVVRLITHVSKPHAEKAATRPQKTEQASSAKQRSVAAASAEAAPSADGKTNVDLPPPTAASPNHPTHTHSPASSGGEGGTESLFGEENSKNGMAEGTGGALVNTVNESAAAAPSNCCPSNSTTADDRTVDGQASLKAAAQVVPRVWTLAGCVHDASLASACDASYVDCSTPSRACFGYLSDMALCADETGNSLLFLLDQTHHAVRVLDSESGVSTYVGPLDYASGTSAVDALPAGLTCPSSLAVAALVKERSPVLLDDAGASMLTPQPYLYSSTPLFFVASAVTGVLSVLLPISQRSEIAPWHTHAMANSNVSSASFERIQRALALGVATEGRRTIGEAAAPSLKHVVAGWGVEAEDEEDDEQANKNNSDSSGGDENSTKKAPAQTRQLLQRARRQQALLYLRLRFPWVLPPSSVPQLGSRLVSACTCHVSGKRQGTTTATKQQQQQHQRWHPSTSDAPISVSLLPRSSRSLSGGRRGGPGGRVVDRAASLPASSPPRRPTQPQQLLFSTPPRHPVVEGPYTRVLKDPRMAAAAMEVADLLRTRDRAGSGAACTPLVVEVKDVEDTPSLEERNEKGATEENSPARFAVGHDGHDDDEDNDDGEKKSASQVRDTSGEKAQGEDAVPVSEALQPRGTRRCSASANPDAERETGRPQGDVSEMGEEVEALAVEGTEERRPSTSTTRSGAAHKWLPPPTKSVSRSPVSTPCRGGGSGSRSSPEAAAAGAATTVKEADSTPQQQQQQQPSSSIASYAAKFDSLPPEQRQLRLLQTLEEATTPSGDGAAQRSPSASPLPENVKQSDRSRQERPHDGKNVQDGAATPMRSESKESITSPVQWPSSRQQQQQQRRLASSASRSPNNSGGRVSPPLTPRSMEAPQHIQRRRTSRSKTAPHVPSSVDSIARVVKASSQELEQESVPCETVVKAQERRVGEMDDGGAGGGAVVLQRDRLPSHAVHEAGEGPFTVSTPTSMAALAHPVRLPTFHDTYDTAVRRLFRVYAYFATRTVTHSVAGTRRLSRPVERYSMSFSAFHRFLTLTGYIDYLADVATAAAAASTTTAATMCGAASDMIDGKASRLPRQWAAHLTQVQRCATAVSPTSTTAAARGGGAVRSGAKSGSFAGRSAAASFTSPVSLASPSSSAPFLPFLLPLAVSDSRAVAEVLYSCGVRTQGYHVVTCMDFQSFRRAVLLLRTWAKTAHQEMEKQQQRNLGGSSAEDDDEEEAAGQTREDDAAAFAYLDRVPSLDALSAEDVVAAYTEVYAQAIKTVPTLQVLQTRMKDAPSTEGEGKEEKQDAANHGAPRPPSSSMESPHLRSFEEAMGLDSGVANAADIEQRGNSNHHRINDSSSNSGSEGEGWRRRERHPPHLHAEVVAATPPVSPISPAKNAEDVSCVLDDDDVHGCHTAKATSAAHVKDEGPSYLSDLLPQEARLALDDLLHLLQRNETTLRRLFDAYSVPVVVHRSSRYEAPRSAAAAAAVSRPCSLILGDNRSFESGSVCAAAATGGDGALGGRRDRAAASVNSTALPAPHRSAHGAKRSRPATSATPAANRSAGSRSAESAFRRLCTVVPSTRQDMWWKVQQLYTMSSLESKEVYERSSHTLHVVPHRFFVELWRTLDVFPSLMTAAATQQAYLDAVTTTLLRGARAPASEAEVATAEPSAAAKTTSDSARGREVDELLFAHTGLTYACFIEAFVRVAMTVFSHEVDRVAYPTSAAKTAGLMQWCNEQMRLGLVEQRMQKRLHNAAAAVSTGASRFSDGGHGGEGPVGGVRRRNSAGSATAAASMLLATRATRSAGVFPDHLQLFHVPPMKRKK